MDRYDCVVVGSGISGLTAALLLARAGRSVLIVEQAPRIGGSLCRFVRRGVPFDTGFHFTGGFSEGGLLDGMLRTLGIREAIVPEFLPEEHANHFLFEDDGRAFDFPSGTGRLAERLKAYFPGEAAAVDRYFAMVAEVCRRTSGMDLGTILLAHEPLDEDYVSLQSVLDGLTGDAHLKALLAAFCMCYGVKPAEVSFANHSRMCQGLYQSIARVRGGGEAFIAAFERAFAGGAVQVRCGRRVQACADLAEGRAGRLILDNGDEVACDTCVFAIHPQAVLPVLPREAVTPAFRARVADFEPSCGFFTVFAAMRAAPDGADARRPAIVSLFPSTDVNALLDPHRAGDSALVIISSTEPGRDGDVRAVSAFEPSFMDDVRPWAESRHGRRPADYREYKRRHAERIRERAGRVLPGGAANIAVLDSASVLTFRDYLGAPDGAAYGVKQKLGQINLFGRLPVRNMFISGQSSLLPGVVGAMMSAFVVARGVLGKDQFAQLMRAGGVCG